jgi:hypothetical protein
MKTKTHFLALFAVAACVLFFNTGMMKAQTPTTVQVKALVQGMWTGSIHRAVPAAVELRSGATPITSTLVDRRTAMISSNGTISVVFPNLTSGSYWLIVRCTGVLPVSSSTALSVTAGNTLSYDFSDNASKAYEDGTIAVTISGNTYYVLKAGDFTGDANVNPTDLNIFLQAYPKVNLSVPPAN